ncbi:MAG: IS21 family transposase [Sphingobacteriales bacterium]|nr:MAG: IS21 family transposase [Sphingobacteriales bacterium]
MANQAIQMSKIRQILRLYHQGWGKQRIASQTGVARNTLKKYLASYAASGLTTEALEALSDKELEDLLVAPQQKPANKKLEQLLQLFPAIDKELRKKGTTRQGQWEMYKQQHPDGLCVSQFKYYYSLWKAQVNPTMHQEHKAGDKCYIDFAGDKLSYTDPDSGEVVPVEVFVAILGASQLTYVEAVRSQQKEDFIWACQNALLYFGGVPAAIVPDNLKNAVTKSSRYEPTLNETFADFASHYATAVLPARAYRPRDKALVEGAVRICYTRIYVPVRKHTYTSLEDLNAAIWEALEVHNGAPLVRRGYSRRQLFEEVERAALMPLPALRYHCKKQHLATVAKNGHVGLSEDKHYYSVPYRYIGRKVKLLYTGMEVEIFYNYERIAVHKRARRPHQYTTDAAHLASTHRFVADWSPEYFTEWGHRIAEEVGRYLEGVLRTRPHPEQAYKACVGILSLAKKVGEERLTGACKRGNSYERYSYGTIERILELGLDRRDPEEEVFSEARPMPGHDNIRGGTYYE